MVREAWGALPDSVIEFLRISIASRDDELRKEKERQQEQIENAKRLGEEAEARALSEARAAEEARKSAKRTRLFSAALALLLFGSLGLAWYAQRTARESKARELAAFAVGSLRDDPEKSIVFGMHAVNATLRFGEAPVPDAEDSLHQAILSSQVRLTLRGHTDAVSGVVFSPDGKRIATSSWDKTAKVWDAESGKELLTLRGHSRSVTGVAFSPDGNHHSKGSRSSGTRKHRCQPETAFDEIWPRAAFSSTKLLRRRLRDNHRSNGQTHGSSPRSIRKR